MLSRTIFRLARCNANRAAQLSTKSPDGIFRRPQTPIEAAPLPQDQELTIDDAQCPEPAFDVDPDIGLLGGAFRIVCALGTIAAFYWMLPDPQKKPYCPGPEGNVIMYKEDYMACRYPKLVSGASGEEAAPAEEDDE
mmetsp:Transcript_13161/g.18217  ORF Transcript_13161/g.18217 Transcript_13161/m.18217 type:complete len:137 (-) Transcript_13161:251-661(-)